MLSAPDYSGLPIHGFLRCSVRRQTRSLTPSLTSAVDGAIEHSCHSQAGYDETGFTPVILMKNALFTLTSSP